MKEVVMPGKFSLLDVPKGKKMYGIILPTAEVVDRDGLGDAHQYDAAKAARYFHTNRKIADYLEAYGSRVFYLGTYTNPSGGKFRLFSFPVSNRPGENTNLTTLVKSCDELKSVLQKFKVDLLLAPCIGMDLGCESYENCIRPVLTMEFDDDVVMIYRKGVDNGEVYKRQHNRC